MITQLIDRDGIVWDAASPSLKVSYGAGRSTKGFSDFVVRNLGFAEVRTSEDSISLKVAPAHLTLTTCATLNDLLDRQAPFRVLLTWYGGQWHHELISGHAAARERLLKLKTQVGNQCSKRQIEVRRPVSTLRDNDPYQKLLEFWRASGQRIDAQQDRETLDNCVNARYAFVHADTETAKLFFDQVGEGIILYEKSWRQLASGSRVEDQPDYEYAKWLSGGYQELMLSNEPCVSDIDALVWSPRQGEQRIRYTRLALPIVDDQGNATLLSATLRDPSIDLRVEFHDEAE